MSRTPRAKVLEKQARAVSLLRKYSVDHPQDVRGRLLLARLYLNRHRHVDALNEYATAYLRDPSCRGAKHMLADCIELVAQGAVSDQAARFVQDAYGAEALSALDRAAASRHDVGGVGLLRALRARIAAN